MSGLPPVAKEFYILDEPKFRWTKDGSAHCALFVKAAQRVKDDSVEGGWRDGKALVATANIYDKPANNRQTRAENVYESLKKGDLVVIVGDLSVREYEYNGAKQKSVEIDVEAIGPSLRFRTTPHGAARGVQTSTSNQQGYSQQGGNTSTTTASVPQQQDDEPPF
jgi:single-stranded DNA-binding protein